MASELRDDRLSKLRHVRASDLSEDTGQTSGMTRREAISSKTVGSKGLWMGQAHLAPHTPGGDHTHGEQETAVYVVSGHPVFVYTENGQEVRLAPEPGDYIFVPPDVWHRDENPGDGEAVIVVARTGSQANVSNKDEQLTLGRDG